MNFLILLNGAILFIIAFFTIKKRLNALENVFIFFISEFLITSKLSILYVNIKVWEVTESYQPFFIFRLYEIIIIPLLFLTYFNLLAMINSRVSKAVFSIIYVFLLHGVELLLVKGGAITYNEWQSWKSLLLIAFNMLITYLLLLGFRHILRTEGAIK